MPKSYRIQNTIVYVSTYPPRECGIATFTEDLAAAFDARFNPATKSRVVALNENPVSLYNYAPKVMDQIAATNVEQYVVLAEELNRREDVKLINIQHEFGLFGGSWGEYLLPFLQVIQKPVVTTFHCILPNPETRLKDIVRFISLKSKAVIVMNARSRELLQQKYGVPRSKIFLTFHGIPQTPFEPSEKFKANLGLKGKTILSTFGFLSRDKGIEYVLRALPAIVKKFPNIMYFILGATHPIVRREEGESYRNLLIREVERLGLKNHVKFYNKYLSLDELLTYLKATDIYVSPLENSRQSVSGTLSYALGCGRPIIATATEYAKQIVRNDVGILVEPRNVPAFGRALDRLLGDEKLVKAMGTRAYESTRKMTWPNVAAEYFRIYKKFVDISAEEKKLPPVKLDHLMRLTDDFGILHHAKYSKPERRYGYSLDDNARALIVCVHYYERYPSAELLALISVYLKFMRFVARPGGSFANIVNSRHERDSTKDDDVQGRGIWALGYAAAADFLPAEIRDGAGRMFRRALVNIPKLQSPRATAFAIIGLYHYLKRFPNAKLLRSFRKLADGQVALYRQNASDDWPWFEDQLTYSNSKLPESLFYAYELIKKTEYLKVASSALKFLSEVTFEPKYYAPIGHNGWYLRYRKRAYFDQQPEDTASMVETKLVAYRATKDKRHLDDAYKAFQWFLGRNHLNQTVYDEVTGGCYDGVGKEGMNLNQGAESTISYLLARLAFEDPFVEGVFLSA